MTEKELIGKIKELRRIKPNQNWVFLTKNRIFEEEKTVDVRSQASQHASILSVLRVFLLRPAYAGLLTIFIIFGLFGFSQNSLPGELLYPIKRIAEKSRAVFVSEGEKTQVSLKLVDARLEELTKIVATNQVMKLAPAINEFQISVSEAAENLAKIDATTTDPVAVKKFVDQAKEIEKRAKEVKSLGVAIEEEELSEVSSRLELELLLSVLENMIEDLENRTLTERQVEILSQMKALVGEGKYSEALELYLTNQ